MRGVELTSGDREVISREIRAGASCREIGRVLGRDHSVVSREVSRNGGRGAYRAMEAQARADETRRRPKPRVLEDNRRLHDEVNRGFATKWSPKQISRRLRADFSDDAR